VPVVLVLGAVGGALVRQRWRRLAELTGLVLRLALLIAFITLALDLRRMAPEEHDTWDDWPTVLYPVLHLTGVVLLAARGIEVLRRRAARVIVKGRLKTKDTGDELAEL
jgi:hypothetical protein